MRKFTFITSMALCFTVVGADKPKLLAKGANPWDTPANLFMYMAQQEEGSRKAYALMEVAKYLSIAGDKKQALATLNRAIETYRADEIALALKGIPSSARPRVRFLCNAAVLVAEAGD